MSCKDDELSLSEVLRALADDAARERIFVRDLVEALGDRALAALMLVFALPNVFPTSSISSMASISSLSATLIMSSKEISSFLAIFLLNEEE